MNIEDWDRVKSTTLEAANRYSVTLSVFDSVGRQPELATGAIVRTKAGACLITARHVIDRFLQLGHHGRLQIGRDRYVLSDIPVGQVSVGRTVDIASIQLTLEQAKETSQAILSWSEVGVDLVEEGTLVAFVGYPGSWKRMKSDASIGIGSYEFFGFVQTVERDQFSVRVDERHEISVRTSPESRSFQGFQEIGGLSGAPVFQAADLPKLIGIVHEGKAWSVEAQKIFALHIGFLDQNGRVTA